MSEDPVDPHDMTTEAIDEEVAGFEYVMDHLGRKCLTDEGLARYAALAQELISRQQQQIQGDVGGSDLGL